MPERSSAVLAALADFGQGVDVLIGEFAVEHETVQRLALPCGAVLRPLNNVLEDRHVRLVNSFFLHFHNHCHRKRAALLQ